jgi:predicted phosphodiesterase
MTRARVLRALALVAVWAVVSVAVGFALFLNSSRTVVLASHDAKLRPTLDGYVVLHTGPVLPDLRLDTGAPIGVDVTLGKTNAASTDELVQRYAVLASQPEGQIAKVERSILGMAVAAALRGAAIGLLPVGIWLAIGSDRRRALLAGARSRQGMAVGLVLVVLVALIWQPWRGKEPTVAGASEWTPLPDYLGAGVPVPEQAADLEVRTDVTTSGSRRLIQSAVDTYDKSKEFYDAAAEAAADLDVRQPDEGDTVVALISDRHDNIGMDAVARAVADAGGATAVFDAGDDTSTGERWEAFSLDSVASAFDDLDRFGVAGNHDHGSFVTNYLSDLGWTMLDGEVIDGPGGTTLLGVNDPRSSGLGNWRDESGLSFTEVGSRLSDVACESEERVSTILVHDANLADEALERGCVDLVVGGHLHVQEGPTAVTGENGQTGYSYTTGTTGGAAYAIAIGSKPRREATIALLTYRDGRPVGIQPVVLQTDGTFEVQSYYALALSEVSE